MEDSSVLEMPLPCGDHQEQQQQWSTGSWSLEDKLCATKGRDGEVTQALGRLEFDFAFDCDCALIFFPLEVRGHFSGAHS